MSGYCKDCGNTICVCKEFKMESEMPIFIQQDGNHIKDGVIKELQAQLKSAKEVIEFYSNKNRWYDDEQKLYSFGHLGEDLDCFDDGKIVNGKRARQWLEKNQ